MYLVGIVISIALFQLGLFLLSNNEPGGLGVDITSSVKWLPVVTVCSALEEFIPIPPLLLIIV